MEDQHRAKSLVVLTLLQLCRAAIKDSEPQWYSANIINDAFQPKSISELFTTEPPSFSTANPIIVSSSQAEEIRLLLTLASPTSFSSSTAGFGTSTTPLPPSSTSFSSTTAGFSPSTTPFPPSSQSISALEQQYFPEVNNDQPNFAQSNQPAGEVETSPINFDSLKPLQPLLQIVSELQAQPQMNVLVQEQSTTPRPIPRSTVTATTLYQPPPTETTQSQELQFQFSQDPQTSLGSSVPTPQPPQNLPPQPNYFLIYQQAPQSFQSNPNPSSSPRTTAGGGFRTTAPPVTSTIPTTFSSLQTFSTMRTVPITMRTTPIFSTTSDPVTQPTVAVTVTPSSMIGSSSLSTTVPGNVIPVNCVPQLITPVQGAPIGGIFPLKIRVVAPSGSITNVNFNARTQAPSTTQRTIRTTTTRKPTTRRTPKPRKNTYERCLQGCRKNGQNLCAAPLSQSPVDPDTLRGFPSVCHMACHNSFRDIPYEKIVDGSCGRLRTRIRPVDSNSKLKRDELNKGQYFLDNSRQPAIVEFSGTYT